MLERSRTTANEPCRHGHSHSKATPVRMIRPRASPPQGTGISAIFGYEGDRRSGLSLRLCVGAIGIRTLIRAKWLNRLPDEELRSIVGPHLLSPPPSMLYDRMR